MKNKLDSIVIVTNEFGSVASVRFENRKDDKDISWTNKNTLYEIVEKYVKEVTGVQSRPVRVS
jgi:hypothetical protein